MGWEGRIQDNIYTKTIELAIDNTRKMTAINLLSLV